MVLNRHVCHANCTKCVLVKRNISNIERKIEQTCFQLSLPATTVKKSEKAAPLNLMHVC